MIPTKAEAAALKLMPKDQIATNIGRSLDCQTTWAAMAVLAVGIVTGFTLGVAATITVAAIRDGDVHIAEDALSELGPGASARRLLEMRRKALITAAKRLAKGASQ